MMQLPLHYTIKEVMDKIREGILTLEATQKEYEKSLEKKLNPPIKTGWFGLQYQPSVDEDIGWREEIFICDTKKEIRTWKEKLAALSKYPEDSKVRLTVEETNTLFPEE